MGIEINKEIIMEQEKIVDDEYRKAYRIDFNIAVLVRKMRDDEIDNEQYEFIRNNLLSRFK